MYEPASLGMFQCRLQRMLCDFEVIMFFRKDPPQTEGRRDADLLIKTPPDRGIPIGWHGGETADGGPRSGWGADASVAAASAAAAAECAASAALPIAARRGVLLLEPKTEKGLWLREEG